MTFAMYDVKNRDECPFPAKNLKMTNKLVQPKIIFDNYDYNCPKIYNNIYILKIDIDEK